MQLEHVDGERLRYSNIDDLAAHYCREWRLAGLRGPYVLFGYSFEGLVALETARQLHERGQAVALLFLLEPPLPAGHGTLKSKILDRFRILRLSSPNERLWYFYEKLVLNPAIPRETADAHVLRCPSDVRA